MIYSVSHDLVYAVVGGSVLLRQVFFFLFSCLFLSLDYCGHVSLLSIHCSERIFRYFMETHRQQNSSGRIKTSSLS